MQVIADGSDANSSNIALGYARGLVAGYAEELTAPRRLRPRRPGGELARRRARLVQPAAREPRLHDSRRARARAARDHDDADVDGDRAGEGARDAGAAQRDAARALGADRSASCCRTRVIGLVDVLLVLAVAIYWFEVPMRGSLPLLARARACSTC